MKIRIVDDLNPEDVAMLQALYSRSAESVDTHLDKVKASGSGKFMERYYVGYGHKSIADCGSTTVFLEGVSLLFAKAVQDWPLYSGQETSTRYIDMSKQYVHNPIGTAVSWSIVRRWMDFYTSKQERVAAQLHSKYPRRDGESAEAHERAIKARTFDILRGFLPAGITTQLSWHTNLRQAGDHLAWLRNHPAAEIREGAAFMTMALATNYSHSGLSTPLGTNIDNRNESELARRLDWQQATAERFAYNAPRSDWPMKSGWGDWGMVHEFTCNSIAAYRDVLHKRPRGCVLPHFMSDLGSFSFEFMLDFGSFRDLQRHRNGVVRMPLLETRGGFEPWYLEQLDDALRSEANQLIWDQQEALHDLDAPAVDKQYLTALGYRVPTYVTFGLPALLYVLELRSSKTVHPTLRAKVLEMADRFASAYPDVTIHIDRDPDDWTVRRGEQMIKERP